MAPKLTLKRLVARPVLVKLERPIVARIMTFDAWPVILIDLETEEGVTGRSYIECYAAKAAKYIVAALEDLGEMLRGKPVSPFDFYRAARNSLHVVGYEGQTMCAVAGLDMAAWDALARAAEVPLCVLLGGSVGNVRAYNTNGLWLKKPEEVGEEALVLRDEGGFDAIKMRMGRADLRDDIAAFEAVRDALGDDVTLMVDFNQSLDLADALERLHAIDDLGLAWIEEPLVYNDLDGCRKLTADLKTPIQIGENFWGPRELYRAIQMGACDFVMPDFMRIGGVTGWQASAALAGAAGVPMSTHLYPEVGAHVMRVTETAHWLEWRSWIDVLLKEPFQVRDGAVEIPDRPGTGLEWDETAVKQLAMS